MRKVFLFSIILLVITVSCSCGPEEKTDLVKIISWNVQNVFDDADDGTEYEDYTSAGHWSSSLYKLRLDNINEVFSYPEFSDCSVLILNEVENEKVVKDIMALKNVKALNLKYYVCAGEENGAINTAIITKYPIINARVHSVGNTRPIIEAELNANTKIHLLACHGKSRKEGVSETCALRLEMGKTLGKISETIMNSNPDSCIVIAGDFNEDRKDSNIFRTVSSGIDVSGSPIGITGKKDPGFWYCFWLDESLDLKAEGSYMYQGKWSCFDNVLLLGKQASDAGVIVRGILKKTDNTPNAWIRNSASGVSDHFPVYLCIKD